MVRIKFRTLSWPAQAITEVNGSTKFAFPEINRANRLKLHHEKESEQ